MIPPPAGLTPDDYDRIEEAVMETARGRWFLAEFARRVRAGDTQKFSKPFTGSNARPLRRSSRSRRSTRAASANG
ncbi:MAG: hypothetical protein HZY79_09655 [Rhodoblastus sp.]|nr:MAG: hypothetical protein HZY79_09655 [Rhodoblastus sp.]